MVREAIFVSFMKILSFCNLKKKMFLNDKLDYKSALKLKKEIKKVARNIWYKYLSVIKNT